MKPFIRILMVVLSTTVLSIGCSKSEEPSPGPDPDPPGVEIPVSNISLSKPAFSLAVGASETLTVAFTPSGATNKEVGWSSDNTDVATVEGGRVTGRKAGIAVITVHTLDGSNRSASCTVTVTGASVRVAGVTLNKTVVTIYAGERETLTETVLPSGATNKTVKWSSNDPDIATVDNGLVTAHKAGGPVTITVTTDDGGATKTCTVTVLGADPNNLLSSTHIPDPVFLDYCRNRMGEWDTNKDGKLTADEASAVRSIDVAYSYGNKISSLIGIEYFTGITYLDCYMNNLTSLDVSKCTRLEELNCSANYALASLDLSGCNVLAILNCSACSLTSLDLSKNTRLTDVSCYSNDLTSIDISKCRILNYLDVENNRLTSLDLSKNTDLKGLTCNNNALASLDLSACTELTSLDCRNNDLASLDLSRNGKLILLSCEANRLASLDLSNNNRLESLTCNNNQLTSLVIGENNIRLTNAHCSSNQLSTVALNTTFETLPQTYGKIAVYGNPGASTCETNIAVTRTWSVSNQ